MTTTSTSPAVKSSPAKSPSASWAASTRFGTFAIVFSLTAPVVYLLCEVYSLPLFTYHPATNRIDFGYAKGRSGEGPAMYWYGWTVTMLIVCTVLGWLATLLPSGVVRKIPLALIWILPILVLIPLAWALYGPFWSKG